MLKIFDKIELDSELNNIKNRENLFSMSKDEFNEKEYIS